MSENIPETDELEQAISDFVSCFELVFHNDWDMTESSIDSKILIKETGTFLEPGVEDESNNWSNRGALLKSYRRLRNIMREHQIEGFYSGSDE